MPLTAGTLLGPYEILAPLGAGGMGEVYRARDPRLGREVAIKVLPDHLAKSPEALARFEREARAVAALSHPNILAIHDFGAEQGVSYVVTELLEGETLRARLRRAALPWRKTVEMGAAVAEGLAAAHAKGIVHRDIKPENLFLTSDGRFKILDFGLARWKPAESQDQGAVPTETEPGVVMGTVGYMSPEQVQGIAAEATSDAFSLGCVLYEMVSGQRAFSRGTAIQTLAAIVEADPTPLSSFGKDLPAELERVIAHCLEKSPGERFQSARDLAFALKAIAPDSSAPSNALQPSRRRVRPALLLAAAAALAVVAFALYSTLGRRQIIDSVAVLPFANASADADTDTDTEYLSDGITESIINSLSQLPELRVMARSTMFRYKGQPADPQVVGRTLGIRGVLTGRVILKGDNLVVRAELVDVSDGSQLWGAQYSRRLSDVFAVQEEIAREISDKLRLRLTGAEQRRLTKRYTESTEAYQLYLKGLYFWNKRTPDTVRKSIDYFQGAIEKDPSYALAYTGLSEAHAVLIIQEVVAPRDSLPRARAAARKAVELDEALADGHAALAHVLFRYDWDWAGAEREFRRAFELNPAFPVLHHRYSMYLAALGRREEAIQAAKRAQELDPLSLIIAGHVGWELLEARRYDEAIEQLTKALEMDPNFAFTHLFLGDAYIGKRRYAEAVAEFQRWSSVSGGPSASVAEAEALAGNKAEARRILAELKERSKQRYTSPLRIAGVHTALAENDQALDWLEKAHEERSEGMAWLNTAPQFDSLRSEPRFQALIRRMGLAP